MEHPLISIACLAALLFCSGCNPSTPTADSELETRPLTELVDLAKSEADEISFCLSEDAGIESIQESADGLQKVIQALSASVSASELPEAQSNKLNKSIGAITEAFDGLASCLESQASSAEISKTNSKLLREIKTLSKLSR